VVKGSGRVAEVAARFTLDALPGRQMAIDADMNNGIITDSEARTRRDDVRREADFYGAMDGASKFVRGDAIAGIIIAVVNIVVGLIIGVFTHNMSFADAARVFTLLTVGDGLVCQIPALIISVSAGIVVTRAGSSDNLSKTLSNQVRGHSKAMYICSAMLIAMAMVPGLPTIPFFILATMFFFFARYAKMALERKVAEAAAATTDALSSDKAAPIESLLHLDPLAIEVGVGLIPLVDSHQDGEILERIVSARKQFAQELGIVVPMVMVRDNIQLRPGEYQIMLKGNPIGRGNLMVDNFLAMDPGNITDPIEGVATKEPAYGLDAIWIRQNQRDDATFRGYTVVNCATVVVTHLTKLIEDNAHLLLGRQDTQYLVDQLKQNAPKAVEEVISADRLGLGEVVKVLQNLLAEKVNIRDILTIFETLADYCKVIKNPDMLTRYVRKALGRSIIRKYLSPDDNLVVVTLDRAIEDMLVASLQHREDGNTSLQIEPQIAQKVLNSIAQTMDKFQSTGTQPILLCGSLIRWDLKQLISRFIPGLVVIAFDEIPSDIQTQSIGIVNLT
jgi:flagellar biosynthesis protein FlhA